MLVSEIQSLAITAQMAAIVGSETFDRLFAGVEFNEVAVVPFEFFSIGALGDEVLVSIVRRNVSRRCQQRLKRWKPICASELFWCLLIIHISFCASE